MISMDSATGKWNSRNIEVYSWTIAKKNKFDIAILKKCYNNSFKPVLVEGK